MKKIVVAVIDSGVHKSDKLVASHEVKELYYDNQQFKLNYTCEKNIHGTEIIKVLLREEPMLGGYVQERDVVLTSMNSVLDNYYEQIRSLTVVAVFMSFVIMLIGIINFINSLVATIINRRRELYMMQNIGLTKSQLRRLLMYEGLDYVVIALFISYVLSSVAVGFGVEAYSSTVWCATFQFTLTPLLICTPLMLMLSLTASYLCYKFIEEQRKREMV